MLTPALSLRGQPVQKVQDAIVQDALTDQSAYHYLERLCDDFGGRLTGSANNQGALLRTVEELKAIGVEARLETFKMPGWVRRHDEATMVAPLVRPLRCEALSYVQPHAPFEADVVDLGDGSEAAAKGLDTQGKIGLLGPNAPTRRGGYNAYAKDLGLKGVLRTCRVAGGQLLARTGSFQGEPIDIPVFSITQEEGLWMSRLLKRGERVRVRLVTRSYCKETDTANIVATFPGRTRDTIILGAHFDSWDPGQGAMDNGLGTAQVFAVAKLLHEHAPHNLRTVQFVWFNGEEQGLWGSRYHASAIKDLPVAAMINLDMVGFPDALNALGASSLVPFLHQFNATLGARKLTKGDDGVLDTNWLGSDHSSFQLVGIRAITFDGPIPPEDVRYYHDFGDTFDKVSPKIINESSATIAALTYWLANVPGLDATRMSETEIKGIFGENDLLARLRKLGLWKADDTAGGSTPPAP